MSSAGDKESDGQSQFSEQSALFDPEKQQRVKERVQKLREKNQAN